MSTRISAGYTLRGTHPFGKSESLEIQELNVVAADSTTGLAEGTAIDPPFFEETGDRYDDRPAEQLSLEEGRLPWSIRAAFSYTKSGDLPAASTLNLSSQVDLTDSWSISYSTQYDATARELRGHDISVARDLHCWRMSLNRSQRGEEWLFYFNVELTAHPDLKVEQGNRGLQGPSTFGGGSFGFR